MACEFGYNCLHFLPTLRKCRRLVDKYRSRPELIEQKWLSVEDALVYLSLSSHSLIQFIASGEVRTKCQKDGKPTLGVLVAAQYDDCFLANSGGTCLNYECHNGRKISCIEDLRGQYPEHPNIMNAPQESAIREVEDELIRIASAAPLLP